MRSASFVPIPMALVASFLSGCGTAAGTVGAPSPDESTTETTTQSGSRSIVETPVPLASSPSSSGFKASRGGHVPGPHHIPSLDGGTTGDAGTTDGAANDAGAPWDGGGVVTGGWEPIVNAPPFIPDVPLLLTDGTVMVHALDDASTWWRLTPSAKGSYASGTWSETAPMPSGYDPLFFASAVLPDGRLIVIGGEYNQGADLETTLGAIYDPRLDVWTPIAPPSSWTYVGDSPSVVLPNGAFMIGSAGSKQEALFDARTLTWSVTGGGKADDNSEEGWTLLPNGKVLAVDVLGAPNSELYDPATGGWSTTGSTGVILAAPNPIYEIGPAMLMPNGSVFATGATGTTAIYSADGTWSPGPSFPAAAGGQLDIADGPAALLPNGNVLCVASAGDYNLGTHFFEFDGTTLTQVSAIPNAASDSSFNIFLFVLPSGQVMATDGSEDIEIFTPGGSPDPSWAPTITTVPTTLVRGTTYPLVGTQLNGLSQAVAYGDDYQGATNYPLVRITNDATSDAFYARTHDHSTMAVATGQLPVSTLFDTPLGAETGASHLVVITNGILSLPVAVTVQ
jgi:hypothetical protein